MIITFALFIMNFYSSNQTEKINKNLLMERTKKSFNKFLVYVDKKFCFKNLLILFLIYYVLFFICFIFCSEYFSLNTLKKLYLKKPFVLFIFFYISNYIIFKEKLYFNYRILIIIFFFVFSLNFCFAISYEEVRLIFYLKIDLNSIDAEKLVFRIFRKKNLIWKFLINFLFKNELKKHDLKESSRIDLIILLLKKLEEFKAQKKEFKINVIDIDFYSDCEFQYFRKKIKELNLNICFTFNFNDYNAVKNIDRNSAGVVNLNVPFYSITFRS